MPTRNINLTPELSELIDAEVASGRYQNASEVVRAGLRLLERSREEQVVRLQALHRVLDAAIVQADRGDGVVIEDIDRFVDDAVIRIGRDAPAGPGDPNG